MPVGFVTPTKRLRGYSMPGAPRKSRRYNLRGSRGSRRGRFAGVGPYGLGTKPKGFVESAFYARRSLSNDINNIIVSAGRSMTLSPTDRVKAKMAPQFSAKAVFSSQNDFVSPLQGIHYRNHFDKTRIEDLWAGAVAAAGSQGTLGTETLPEDRNINSALQGTTLFNQHRKKKLLIYGRYIDEKFVNSCNNPLDFTVYYIKTKKPISTSDGSTIRPTSFADLMTKLGNGTGSTDELTSNQTDYIGTRDISAFTLSTPGNSPLSYDIFRHYYKCFKKVKFTLKPGEQTNLRMKLPGMRIINGMTYLDTVEYPGLWCATLIVCRAGIVGSEGAGEGSVVSYGSGQYSHITEVYAKSKFIRSTINYKGTFGALTAIAGANQQHINPEDQTVIGDYATL